MSMSDELRKSLSDPKPLYALAGAGDLAAEKLKEAPAMLTELSGTVTDFATRIAASAPEQLAKVQSKFTEVQVQVVGEIKDLDPRVVLDPKAAREALRDVAGKADVQALRDRAQTVALTQVGRLLEAAGKAVETYDELAERGKDAVRRYRGEEGDAPADGDVTVVVEQVVFDDPADLSEPLDVSGPGPIVDADFTDDSTASTSKPGDAPKRNPSRKRPTESKIPKA